MNENSYKLDNIFSIRCIDGDIPKAIGSWAGESEQPNDTNMANHHADTAAGTTDMLMECIHMHILHQKFSLGNKLNVQGNYK